MTLVYGAKKRPHADLSKSDESPPTTQDQIRDNVITMYMTSRQDTHS